MPLAPQIASDADGQKSYNYRVVMNCQGAELDMRGRCSAGQKVRSFSGRVREPEAAQLRGRALIFEAPWRWFQRERQRRLAAEPPHRKPSRGLRLRCPRPPLPSTSRVTRCHVQHVSSGIRLRLSELCGAKIPGRACRTAFAKPLEHLVG